MEEVTSFIVKLMRDKRKRKEKGHKAKLEIKEGEVHGMLTILEVITVKDRAMLTYLCSCTCGNNIELSYNSIRKKQLENIGCLQPMCTATIRDDDKWLTNRDTVLYDQFRRLTVYLSNELCEEWGGGNNPYDLRSAYEEFYAYTTSIGANEDNGLWFISRVNKKGIFEPSNVEMVKRDKLPGIQGEEVFIYEENVMSLSEASIIFGCSISEIKELQVAFISDEDIFESFI